MISYGAEQSPVWSQKNKVLFYQYGDKIMAVRSSVKGGTFLTEDIHAGAEKLVGLPGEWDLPADGKRLLLLAPVLTKEGPKPDHEVTFLLNFSGYLRQRVEVNK